MVLLVTNLAVGGQVCLQLVNLKELGSLLRLLKVSYYLIYSVDELNMINPFFLINSKDFHDGLEVKDNLFLIIKSVQILYI